jgi:uncharacterized paraquat-inducible protein A
MPRRTFDDDEWDDESEFEPDSDDSEWEPDDSLDEDEPTIECPGCGREIHEDSPRCPHCERYLSTEDSPPPRKPWWIVVGTIICLYLVYRWTFG